MAQWNLRASSNGSARRARALRGFGQCRGSLALVPRAEPRTGSAVLELAEAAMP